MKLQKITGSTPYLPVWEQLRKALQAEPSRDRADLRAALIVALDRLIEPRHPLAEAFTDFAIRALVPVLMPLVDAAIDAAIPNLPEWPAISSRLNSDKCVYAKGW
jgi:hypothetical protein